MKDYRKSEYAKNKMNRTAIVYTHAGEVEVRLTFEKVSKDQPEITKSTSHNHRRGVAANFAAAPFSVFMRYQG